MWDTGCLPPAPIPLGDGASLQEALHLPRTLSTQATDVFCGWQMPELSKVASGPSTATPPTSLCELAFSTKESSRQAMLAPHQGLCSLGH